MITVSTNYAFVSYYSMTLVSMVVRSQNCRFALWQIQCDTTQLYRMHAED